MMKKGWTKCENCHLARKKQPKQQQQQQLSRIKWRWTEKKMSKVVVDVVRKSVKKRGWVKLAAGKKERQKKTFFIQPIDDECVV